MLFAQISMFTRSFHLLSLYNFFLRKEYLQFLKKTQTMSLEELKSLLCGCDDEAVSFNNVITQTVQCHDNQYISQKCP